MTNRTVSGSILLLGALLPLAVFAQPDVPAEEWQELFDGRSLDGWVPKIRGYELGDNFADTFRVEDGFLTVSYDGYESYDSKFGHIFYQEPFSHYWLRVEYRFVGEQAPEGPGWALRNSGAMLHSQPPETMGLSQDFPISLEVQYLGRSDTSTANLCTPGTNVVYKGEFTSAHCINSTSPIFADEQWVTNDVLVLGSDRMEHYINGEKVIEYTDMTKGGGSVSGHDPALLVNGEPLGGGYISLQSESHPVQFRRVSVLNLKGCMNPDSDAFRDYFVESDPDACN